MVHLITNRDELLLSWAAKKITHIGDPKAFMPAATLGIATGPAAGDRLLAVAIYHMFVPSYRSCMISIAAASPRWCARGTIKEILRIPFYQYDCNRVWLAIPHLAERTVKLAKALGFKQEGVLREGFGPGIHTVVCGMLRREFERRYKVHGKEIPITAGRA